MSSDSPNRDARAKHSTGKSEKKKVSEICERAQTEDMRTKAMLAMSRYCQEQWVKRMIQLHISRGEKMKCALLSGDAGCGKSYAISLLVEKLKLMNVSVVVSAMTNKAAGALMESRSLTDVHTFHRMMGFKRELLRGNLSRTEFTERYREIHRPVMEKFAALRGSPGSGRSKTLNVTRHSCAELRPESCAVCSAVFQRLKMPTKSNQQGPMDEAPPFLGVNVLIVDEYGLLTTDLLERTLCCLSLFYGSERGPLIIFSGSVSQLQPVGSESRIWESERFERTLSCSTPLFVNRRQFEDPEYAEAVTYLQFNMVTEESRRIFRSRVAVREHEVLNPEFQPEKLRVFHQDKQQKDYTQAYVTRVAAKRVRVGEKYLKVTGTGTWTNGPKTWYDALKQATLALPKLFSLPAYREGRYPTERDYLTLDRVWIGCRVRLIWHMDVNGIVPAESPRYEHRLASRNARRKRLRSTGITDTEGIVESITSKPDPKNNVFHVRGSHSGTLYKVGLSKWLCHRWTVTTHPLTCLLAMNTYDCQGSTVHGEVLYHPPKCFSMSPIKPSVYVVLSRVVRRENLQMTNCNFADAVGRVNFYDDRLVMYRKRVEMNYSFSHQMC